MKKFVFAALLLVLGASHASAMLNPASAFCVKLGGQSQIAQYPNGDQFRLCRLSNGNIYEEWTLFRMFHGQQ